MMDEMAFLDFRRRKSNVLPRYLSRERRERKEKKNERYEKKVSLYHNPKRKNGGKKRYIKKRSPLNDKEGRKKERKKESKMKEIEAKNNKLCSLPSNNLPFSISISIPRPITGNIVTKLVVKFLVKASKVE
jgi:hypothetical protein